MFDVCFCFMIVGVTGSVGCGKTDFAKMFGERLDFEVVNLTDWAMKYKIGDVEHLQTFDFDLDKFLDGFEDFLRRNHDKNIIFEGHFAHFVSPDLVDLLFVVNRDLGVLRKEYERRGYNKQKIEDNLEVESFNLCFYEALEEGYDEDKICVLDNCSSLDDLVDEGVKRLESVD